MPMSWSRTVCWTPTWNKAHEGVGLEHLLLDQRAANASSWRSTMSAGRSD